MVGAGVSQCCADTETSSCITHLNEQPVARHPLSITCVQRPPCSGARSQLVLPPPHTQACLYHRTFLFVVTFTPRVQPAQTNQLHTTPARLLREASHVAFDPPAGVFRPDLGPGAKFSLLKGARACDREGSEPRGVVPLAGKGLIVVGCVLHNASSCISIPHQQR